MTGVAGFVGSWSGGDAPSVDAALVRPETPPRTLGEGPAHTIAPHRAVSELGPL